MFCSTLSTFTADESQSGSLDTSLLQNNEQPKEVNDALENFLVPKKPVRVASLSDLKKSAVLFVKKDQ